MKTIEKLAEEAGFSELRAYLTAAADGSMSRNNSEQLASEALSDLGNVQRRLAALVAEQCAGWVLAGTVDAERHSGAEAAGHLDAAAARILAGFPKP